MIKLLSTPFLRGLFAVVFLFEDLLSTAVWYMYQDLFHSSAANKGMGKRPFNQLRGALFKKPFQKRKMLVMIQEMKTENRSAYVPGYSYSMVWQEVSKWQFVEAETPRNVQFTLSFTATPPWRSQVAKRCSISPSCLFSLNKPFSSDRRKCVWWQGICYWCNKFMNLSFEHAEENGQRRLTMPCLCSVKGKKLLNKKWNSVQAQSRQPFSRLNCAFVLSSMEMLFFGDNLKLINQQPPKDSELSHEEWNVSNSRKKKIQDMLTTHVFSTRLPSFLHKKVFRPTFCVWLMWHPQPVPLWEQQKQVKSFSIVTFMHLVFVFLFFHCFVVFSFHGCFFPFPKENFLKASCLHPVGYFICTLCVSTKNYFSLSVGTAFIRWNDRTSPTSSRYWNDFWNNFLLVGKHFPVLFGGVVSLYM